MADTATQPSIDCYRLVPRSIRGVMLLTVFAAVVSTYHAYAWPRGAIRADNVYESLLFALALILAIGLIQQSLSLWRYRRHELPAGDTPALLRQLRFGVFVGVSARLTVAAMLILTAGIRGVLDSTSAIKVPEWASEIQLFWEPLLPIWMIVAASFSRQARRKPSSRRVWPVVAGTLSFIAIAIVLLIQFTEALVVPYLIFAAIRGIEFSIADIRTPPFPELGQDVLGRLGPACAVGLLTLIPLVIVLWALWRFRANVNHGTQSQPRRAGLYLIIAFVVAIIYTAMIAWNVFDLLPNAAPLMMAESSEYSLAEILVNGIPLVLLASFTLAIRLSRRSPPALCRGAEKAADAKSRTDGFAAKQGHRAELSLPVCWHERPVVLLTCAAVVFLAIGGVDTVQNLVEWIADSVSEEWWLIWAQIVYYADSFMWDTFLIDPMGPRRYLLTFIALAIFCLVLAWRGRKKAIARIPVYAPDYGVPGRFWILLLLVTWLVIVSIPQICITGFMLNIVHIYL